MKEGSKHTPETKQKQREKMLKTLNAEYWTAELVQSTLFEMIEFLNKDYTIEVSTKIKDGEKSGGKGDFEFSETSKDTIKEKKKRRHHTKVTVLQNFDILNFNWFSDMRAKFKENETISLMLLAITEICENNVYNDAANGAVNAGVANLLLMTKHNWKAKTENDNNNKESNVNIELPKPTDEALKRWNEAQIKE